MKVAYTTDTKSLKEAYDELVQESQNQDPNFTPETRNQIGRNRYSDVLPNEATRFTIPGTQFYFNANWVFDQTAIACQGPLQKEIDQFWEMVWHADVLTIVMVANPIEAGKRKCSMYWKDKPCSEEVIFQNEEHSIVKRTIELTKGEEKRTIIQYQLVNWSDKGVISPELLAELVKLVSKEQGKILVHCSAGIGRTGTFFAAYGALMQGTDQIFDIVRNLRHPLKGRVGMVQTLEQYELAQQTAQLLLNKSISIDEIK